MKSFKEQIMEKDSAFDECFKNPEDGKSFLEAYKNDDFENLTEDIAKDFISKIKSKFKDAKAFLIEAEKEFDTNDLTSMLSAIDKSRSRMFYISEIGYTLKRS